MTGTHPVMDGFARTCWGGIGIVMLQAKDHVATCAVVVVISVAAQDNREGLGVNVGDSEDEVLGLRSCAAYAALLAHFPKAHKEMGRRDRAEDLAQ